MALSLDGLGSEFHRVNDHGNFHEVGVIGLDSGGGGHGGDKSEFSALESSQFNLGLCGINQTLRTLEIVGQWDRSGNDDLIWHLVEVR